MHKKYQKTLPFYKTISKLLQNDLFRGALIFNDCVGCLSDQTIQIPMNIKYKY